jgi:hypothetical protein
VEISTYRMESKYVPMDGHIDILMENKKYNQDII